MLKKTFLILSVFSAITLLPSFKKDTTQKVLRTVIIDAGHGGKDQGAEGLITTEAQLCLEISKKLGKQIGKDIPGIKILYTRAADVLPGNKSNKDDALRYRADFANSSGADLFISIHCNAAGKQPGGWYEKKIIDYNYKISYVGKGKKRKKVTTKIPVYQPYYVVNETNGTETFIWTAKENSHKAQIVGNQNEFSSEEDSTITVPDNDPVINALRLLYTKKYFKNSFLLAELVQQEFEKSGRINRGVKQRNEKGIWVLHATGMPSVLIETGFISNKKEEEYLVSEKGQDEIVDNITSALKNYVSSLEKQQTPAGNATGTTPAANKMSYGFMKLLDDHQTRNTGK
ncbi:MAG: N-acetylmuramoyl-L-alanine amidase [Chitinophagaceae bacterium]